MIFHNHACIFQKQILMILYLWVGWASNMTFHFQYWWIFNNIDTLNPYCRISNNYILFPQDIRSIAWLKGYWIQKVWSIAHNIYTWHSIWTPSLTPQKSNFRWRHCWSVASSPLQLTLLIANLKGTSPNLNQQIEKAIS